MSAKLEIEIDEPLLQQAEAWAQRRGITLSSAVAAYLRDLTRDELPPPRSDWLKHLAGIARPVSGDPVEATNASEYIQYLEKKYS